MASQKQCTEMTFLPGYTEACNKSEYAANAYHNAVSDESKKTSPFQGDEPSGNHIITIFVKNPHFTQSIHVYPSTTVKEVLQASIERAPEDFKTDSARLSFMGKLLEESETLEECNVLPFSTLFFVL